MSINKSASIRYHVLDRCFQNFGRKFFIQDLLAAVNDSLTNINPNAKGIKLRQLYDDIRHMESPEGYDARIERHSVGKKKWYRYADREFSIRNAPIKDFEVAQIKSAIDIISRFKGMPLFGWINEFAPKLQQAFTLENNRPAIISFDENSYLEGIGYIGELFQSILNTKVLNIQYRSFKATSAKNFIIHPYYLKQYNNRWFIFGLENETRHLIHLALDRIEDLHDEIITYIPNSKYDFTELFEDIVGVSNYNRSKIYSIVIEVSDDAAPYILSKPLHGSQKIRQKNPLIITLDLKLNNELETLLLSFGERIVVKSPIELKNNLSKRLKTAFSIYSM